MFKKLYSACIFLGLDPIRFVKNIRGLSWFWNDYHIFKKMRGNDLTFPTMNLFPALNDKQDNNGNLKGHYFHQDLLVAQRVFTNNPVKHVDIGSRIDGFIAHLASFRVVEVFDIRPLSTTIPNINFTQADLMQLDSSLLNYTMSISCLHTIEHFGLGRYNDPIDPEGHLKGLANINRVLCPGGIFYFSTPIGPQRIEFNAHRVFSLVYLLNLFNSGYDLVHFSYIDDSGDLHRHVSLTPDGIATNFNCQYGCGIFELRKKLF